MMATKHDREVAKTWSEKRRLTLDEAYSLMCGGGSFENQALYQATAFRNTSAVRVGPGSDRKISFTRDAPDVQSIPRLVMVDEICMWILAPKTIVTGFPERCGQGLRFGQSSIHTRIREKISQSPGWKLGTVFDLALMILEECCQAFFAPPDATGDCPGGLIDIFTEQVYRQVRLLSG